MSRVWHRERPREGKTCLTSDDYLWSFFPLVGWGIGLAIHYTFAVRWGDREVRKHQEAIEHLAERKSAA